MLYPSKVSGQSYVMPSNIYKRKGVGTKYDSGRILLLGDEASFERIDTEPSPGAVRITQNSNVQINIITTKGYGAAIVETDRSKLINQKFMQDNTDWHNIEMTIVFKYTGGSDLSSIILGTRTGLGKLDPCAGFSYKAGLTLNGLTGFISKQQFYPEGNDSINFNVSKMGSSIKNRYVALKFVVYDIDDSGEATTDTDEAVAVKIELYGSIDAKNPFRILKEAVDDGDWGNADVCGGAAGLIGLWGGPVSTVEWSDDAQIQIQALSIREIDPNAEFDDTMRIPSLSFVSTIPTEPTESEENTTTGSTTDISTGSVNDSLGVQQIYKTKPGGSVWISTKTGLLKDPQFNDNGLSIKSNGDGTYHAPGHSRMNVFCSKAAASKGPDFDGYSTHDFNELKKRGTWDDKVKDWRDVEMTAYVKMKSVGSGQGDEVSWVVRSVRHNNSSNNGCGGSSYHGNLLSTGFPRFKKEDWHVSYQNDQPGPKGIGSVKGKTVGLKFCLWNLPDNESVKMEIWLDKNNDNKWEKYHDKLDAGDWTTNGPDMKACGALSNTAVISWGSPKVIWKWNPPMDLDISKMSVREIIPTREDGTSPPPPSGGGGDTGGGTGGTGQISRILTRYIGTYDVIVDSTGQTCAGAAPPSGSGSYTPIPSTTVTTITDRKPLAKMWDAEDNRTECGWYVANSSSRLHGKKPTRIGVYLRRSGTVIGTLHVYAKDNSGNIVVEYGTGLDVSTISTANSYTLYEVPFTNDLAPLTLTGGLKTDWRIAVVWSDNSGNEANHIDVGVNYNNPIDGTNTIEYQWETEPGPDYALLKFTKRDMAGKIYTSP